MNRLRFLFFNLLWFLTCLPRYLRFRRAVRNPGPCQAKRLRRILRANADTEYGREHRFRALDARQGATDLPLTAFDD